MGAVHPIFEVAAEANIALIVQVKDNQPTLNEKLQQIAAATPTPACLLASVALPSTSSSQTRPAQQDRYRAALAGIDNLLEDLAIP